MDKAKIKNIAIIIVSSLALFFVYNGIKRLMRTDSTYVAKKGGSCPGEVINLTQKDPYMRGILKEGDKFKVITNYYDCNPLKRNDIVFYQLNKAMDPVVKIVRGMPGDNFRVLHDEKKRNWNLEIEGDLVKSELDNKTTFFFGGPVNPPLSLYEKTFKGKIQEGDILILSSWPPGDLDSGMFGMFSTQGIIGKVVIGEQEVVTQATPEEANATPTPAPSPSPALSVKSTPAQIKKVVPKALAKPIKK